MSFYEPSQTDWRVISAKLRTASSGDTCDQFAKRIVEKAHKVSQLYVMCPAINPSNSLACICEIAMLLGLNTLKAGRLFIKLAAITPFMRSRVIAHSRGKHRRTPIPRELRNSVARIAKLAEKFKRPPGTPEHSNVVLDLTVAIAAKLNEGHVDFAGLGIEESSTHGILPALVLQRFFVSADLLNSALRETEEVKGSYEFFTSKRKDWEWPRGTHPGDYIIGNILPQLYEQVANKKLAKSSIGSVLKDEEATAFIQLAMQFMGLDRPSASEVRKQILAHKSKLRKEKRRSRFQSD